MASGQLEGMLDSADRSVGSREPATGDGHTTVKWWGWAVAATVAGVCLLSGLDSIGLVGPDEPRYAEVAREMVVSEDWVTPRLWGQPWFEKPVLYYWGAASAMRVFGPAEFAARLPSALAALIALAALVWAALRQYDPRTALCVALTFPACVGVIGFARAAGPDMLFAAGLAVAMMTAADVATRPGENVESPGGAAAACHKAERLIGRRIALGVSLGVATLAKGPAALLLAGGSVLLWAAATRRWRPALFLLHPWAITAWAATSLPWYVVCARRNPEFLRVFLYEHNLLRYLTPEYRHEQPVWFFLPVALIGILPWTAWLAGVARDAWQAWKQRRWPASTSFFYACWALWPLLFFSFSSSKLPGYILVIVAPLAMVIARSVAGRAAAADAWTTRIGVLVGITVVLLSLLVAVLVYAADLEFGLHSGISVALAIAITVASLCVAVLAGKRRVIAAGIAAALVIGCLVGVLSWDVLGKVDAHYSPREAAKGVGGEPARENVYVYRVHRAWKYGLEFYQKKALQEWDEGVAMPAWVFTTREGMVEMEKTGRRVHVVESKSANATLVYVFH